MILDDELQSKYGILKKVCSSFKEASDYKFSDYFEIDGNGKAISKTAMPEQLKVLGCYVVYDKVEGVFPARYVGTTTSPKPFIDYLTRIRRVSIPDREMSLLYVILDSEWFRTILTQISNPYLFRNKKGRLELSEIDVYYKKQYELSAMELIEYILTDIADLSNVFSEVPEIAKKIPTTEDIYRYGDFDKFASKWVCRDGLYSDCKFINESIKNSHLPWNTNVKNGYPVSEDARERTNKVLIKSYLLFVQKGYFLCIPSRLLERLYKKRVYGNSDYINIAVGFGIEEVQKNNPAYSKYNFKKSLYE